MYCGRRGIAEHPPEQAGQMRTDPATAGEGETTGDAGVRRPVPKQGWMDVPRIAHWVLAWLQHLPAASTRADYATDLGLMPVVAESEWCDQLQALAARHRLPVPLACSPGHPDRAKCPYSTWLPWCAINGIDPLADVQVCSGQAVSAWMTAMTDCGLAPSTRQRRLVAVRRWYAYLRDHGVLDCHPATWTRVPNAATPVTAPVTLSPGMVTTLIDSAEQADTWLTPVTAARLRVAVGMLATLALRVGELLALRLDDWDPNSGLLTIHRHKGGGVDRVRSPGPEQRWLAAYLALRRAESGRPLQPDAPLLATPAGQAWHATRLRAQLRRLCEKSASAELRAIADRIHPHALRAAAITHLLDAGYTLTEAQALARHRDINTTARYDRYRDTRHRDLPRQLAELRRNAH